MLTICFDGAGKLAIVNFGHIREYQFPFSHSLSGVIAAMQAFTE